MLPHVSRWAKNPFHLFWKQSKINKKLTIIVNQIDIAISIKTTSNRVAEIGFKCHRIANKLKLTSAIKLKCLSWNKQHQCITAEDWKNVNRVVFQFCVPCTIHISIPHNAPSNLIGKFFDLFLLHVSYRNNASQASFVSRRKVDKWKNRTVFYLGGSEAPN